MTTEIGVPSMSSYGDETSAKSHSVHRQEASRHHAHAQDAHYAQADIWHRQQQQQQQQQQHTGKFGANNIGANNVGANSAPDRAGNFGANMSRHGHDLAGIYPADRPGSARVVDVHKSEVCMCVCVLCA